MLIGHTWIEKARLRILNGLLAVPAAGAWGVFAQIIVLSNKERGIVVGLQQLFSACAGGVLDTQIIFNGTTEVKIRSRLCWRCKCLHGLVSRQLLYGRPERPVRSCLLSRY
jgi:hypothetical protein